MIPKITTRNYVFIIINLIKCGLEYIFFICNCKFILKDFEPWVLGITVVLGSFMTFAGILAYKYFFFKVGVTILSLSIKSLQTSSVLQL